VRGWTCVLAAFCVVLTGTRVASGWWPSQATTLCERPTLAAAWEGRRAANRAETANAAAAEPPATEAPAQEDPVAARDLLERFFREADEDARRTLAEQFGEVVPSDWKAVKRMLHEAAPREPLTPGTHEFKATGGDPVPPIRYVLRVPEGYEPNRPHGLPLIVACHWTKSTAERAMKWIGWVLGPDLDNYLVACPDSPDPDIYRAGRVTNTYPLHVLADVRRRANVDADRVVLTGYSRGGYQTWATALFSPGLWAGAVPIASAPISEAGLVTSRMYLANVLNLPIQTHWGDRDIIKGQAEGINTLSKKAAEWFAGKNAEHFEGIEYEGQGHDLDLEGDRIRAFVAKVRRNSWPERIDFLFHRLHEGRAYYVRATKAAVPGIDFRDRVPVRGVRLPEKVPEALQRIWTRKGYHLTVRLDAERNLIAVMARNLTEVAVDLPAERLDFARPIHVTVNSRTRYGKQQPVDWACLLETARETYDFERLVGRRVTATAR